MLDLWELRFKKILEQEEEAVRFYSAILKRRPVVLNGSRLKLLIRKLVKEERRHVEVARRLLEIVDTGKQRLTHKNGALVSKEKEGR